MSIKHPWIEAAEQFGPPHPVPTGVKFDLISVGQGDDEKQDMVLLMAVTPEGCTSVFLDVDMFVDLISSGADIIRTIQNKKADSNSHVKTATQTDLRNAVRGLTLLHDVGEEK